MNLEAYNQRLQLLLEQKIITSDSHDIALAAFTRLMERVDKSDIEHGEMLFTHLPMALTRIEASEEVERPTPGIMREVEESTHFPLAKEQIAFIEEKWGKSLPEGEKEYLYLHYTTVLNSNL
jgi:hypothetical protein